jgi:hypothetical protein
MEVVNLNPKIDKLPVKYVISQLVSELPGVVEKVFINVHIANLLECDAIIVGRGFVCVLDVREFSGEIEGDSKLWLTKSRPIPSPIRSAEHKAHILADYLTQRITGVKRRMAISFLVVIVGNFVLKVTDSPSRLEHVVPSKNVATFFRQEFEGKSKSIDREFIDLVGRTIFDISRHEISTTISQDLTTLDIEGAVNPLTPEYLASELAPYLEALTELQHLIDNLRNKPVSRVAIQGMNSHD